MDEDSPNLSNYHTLRDGVPHSTGELVFPAGAMIGQRRGAIHILTGMKNTKVVMDIISSLSNLMPCLCNWTMKLK